MKRKINIALILVVIFLWGYLGYRVLSKFFSAEISLPPSRTEYISQPKITEKDTFHLGKLNRDPFLGKTYLKEYEKTKSVPFIENKNSKKTVKPERVFPMIQYYGYIKSHNSNDKVVVMQIDGKMKRLKINESFEGIKVHKIFNDSIFLLYNGQLKSFNKS